MATFTKTILSQSDDGRGRLITGTNSAGAASIHTASSTVTTIDEVWLYAQNQSAADVKLTIEYGSNLGTADPIEVTVVAESGLMLIIPGLILKGNSSPKTISGFAGTINVISVFGYVNQITA